MALVDHRRVRFALLPTEEGGRRAPVRSGYRPGFWLGLSTNHMPMLHDAAVTLVGTQTLSPGETGVAELAPVVDEPWMQVANGQTLPCYEGSRLIGDAIVMIDGPSGNGRRPAVRQLAPARFERLVSVLASTRENSQRHELELGDRSALDFVVSSGARIIGYQVRSGRKAPPIDDLQDTFAGLADARGVNSLRVVSQFDPPAVALHQMRSVATQLDIEAAWYTPDWIVDQLRASPLVSSYFLAGGRDVVLKQLRALRAARNHSAGDRETVARAIRALNNHDPFRIWALPGPAYDPNELVVMERYPGAAEDAEQEGLAG